MTKRQVELWGDAIWLLMVSAREQEELDFFNEWDIQLWLHG